MSCNGCRVLRKGCSESCVLRPCLQWIETGEAQGHATVFVAKFFGRAGLMSFISAVPELQRPALFQSLLFEACGRTVNPVNGAVGLLWTGNWHLCQAAVETVLRGGTVRAVPELAGGAGEGPVYERRVESPVKPRKAGTGGERDGEGDGDGDCDLQLFLSPKDGGERKEEQRRRRRTASPSMNSDGSVTTSAGSGEDQLRLLNLFI